MDSLQRVSGMHRFRGLHFPVSVCLALSFLKVRHCGRLFFIWDIRQSIRMLLYIPQRISIFLRSHHRPASAFFMIKDGMPATTVMAALLVNLIMYTLAVISIGVFAILAFPKIFLNFSVVCKIFIVSGIIVLSVLAIIFYLLLRKQEILKKLAVWLEAFLRKIHCVHAADRVQNKMEAALKDYANCVELIFHKKRVLWKAFLLNLLQRMSQIMVTLFTFFAIHGDLSKIWELFATQIYVVLGSNCVPIPGAIGVADYLMLSGYKELMSKSDAYHLEILSRGLSFYGCMMISMITVLVGYICLRKKEIRRDK